MKDDELHVVAYDLRESVYIIPQGYGRRICGAEWRADGIRA
jgi:hypothetical protein